MLDQLERRFNKQPQLKKEYTEVIDEYLRMGHMEEVPEDEIHKDAVYLLHHAVIRYDKETSKTRIVFNASNKGTNNVSLNDELLTGPVLQEDLRSIIMRWRMHKICFASDLEKMYRMVLVKKEDADFQRVLWRQNTSTSDEVKDYRLLTVTFGTASAPYLAVKTLMQIADDEGEEQLRTTNQSYAASATKMIREDFYVDDLLSGCDTVQEAIATSQQLITILSKGKFRLQKWSSNNAEFLRSIDPKDRSNKANMDLTIDGTVKALGVSWNLGRDEFHYNINLPPNPETITKRVVLADLQRLFDPLGWIAPVIVMAKIFVQRLWLLGVGWDSEIDDQSRDKWLKIKSDLENLTV
ncbi:unnamed protein product [Plutella xylostella]|uniref:(diamondback moth) hypothetical protein n=1 Tax=Plutella xylostella TaxID=51655 RepID=A0A8S4GBA2_PLUXY|nr:unnamed protein product [Plutella xylostella]